MSLDERTLEHMLDSAKEAARLAGEILKEGLFAPKSVTHKGEVDLVTAYDPKAEAAVKEHLLDRFPDTSVLAEEEGLTGASTTQWIVDPLDGTTNFAHSHPIFAVSIGLQHENEIQVGVIALPALGIAVWAKRGTGAYNSNGPISVSSTDNMDTSLMATGFPYDRRAVDDDNTAEFKAIMKHAQGVRRCGAAAVDMAFVAQGIYDGFWEPRLKPWDLAAGHLIVEEAGGKVTNYENEPLDLEKGWVVATNGKIHNEVISVIHAARRTLK